MEICLLLYWEFCKIGLFCIGGGYASMPWIQAAVVDNYHWLTMSEFIDIFTISQPLPRSPACPGIPSGDEHGERAPPAKDSCYSFSAAWNGSP